VTRQNKGYKKSEGITVSGCPFTSCQLLIKHHQANSRFEHLEGQGRYDDVSGQVLLRADGVGGEARKGSGKPCSLVGPAVPFLYSASPVPVAGVREWACKGN
jgi:hypothetical protein